MTENDKSMEALTISTKKKNGESTQSQYTCFNCGKPRYFAKDC